MEGGESILDTILENENLEDVEMLDVEEGELVEPNSPIKFGQSSGQNNSPLKQESCNKNWRRKGNKRKNRRRKGSSSVNVTDVNKFVLDVCKRLKEKKSYLVYTAVGCLGVAALSDLVKEVDAIQACGGQKTADGKRFRNGGGILWNILKLRDPNAYKEIMIKGRDFEKQFRQQNKIQQPKIKQESASVKETDTISNNENMAKNEDDSKVEEQNIVPKHASVHDRIRAPVTYDDLLGDEEWPE